MNQQSFASLIGLSPASLSNILQERTRPTLKTVEAIHQKIPNININWLLYGNGPMYIDSQNVDQEQTAPGNDIDNNSGQSSHSDNIIGFSFEDDEPASTSSQPAPYSAQPSTPQPGSQPLSQTSSQPTRHNSQSAGYGSRSQRPSAGYETQSVKNFDKPSRRITEIRVFYDDQTWESFVPKR